MAFGVRAREDDGAGAPYRNRGFGRETVSGLLSLGRDCGFSEAHLWVGISNELARQLYERLGFRLSGRRKLDDRGELIAHVTASLESV